MSDPVIILVDADACPVKDEIYRVAARYKAPVRIVSNSPFRIPDSPLVKRVLVDDTFDAADNWIAEPTPEGMTDEEMYDRTFAYLGSVLERAGSSWDDVVDLTTYHVDIDQSLPSLAAAKNKVVKAPFPAWTAIDIDRLFTPDGLVEIKITARLTPAEEAE